MNTPHPTARHLILFLSLLALVALAACAPAAAPAAPAAVSAPQRTPAASTPTPAAARAAVSVELTEQVLRNATYELPDVGTFQLKDGKAEQKYGTGATQVNRMGLTLVALGDLNGDGIRDAIVSLWWNGGGSGTFVYLVAVVNQGGVPRQAAAELLGDRVEIQSISIKDGQILVNVQAFAPSDPLCCPSRNVDRVYRLAGNKLAVVSEARPSPSGLPPAPASSLANVKFNPATHKCANEPARILTDHTWQTYAAPPNGKGGDPVQAKQPASINLRNKFGGDKEQLEVTVNVITPASAVFSTRFTLKGTQWGTVVYPKDFGAAPSPSAGTYTVVWQVNGSTITCDGFVVIE